MRCPSCRQEIEQPLQQGACPMCGAAVAARTAQAKVLYVIVAALFSSLFMYGLLVFLLDSTGFKHPSPPPPELVRDALAALSLCLIPMMLLVGAAVLKQPLPNAPMTAAIAQGAVAEAPAIMGLALYFLGFGADTYLMFAAISVAMYVYLFTRLPVYARMLEEPGTGNG
jgi:hypothetical protein